MVYREHCSSPSHSAEYSDQDADVRIKNESGEVVFESSLHIRYALTWFWKELLIIDATPKPDPFSSTILADLKKFDQTEGVFELIEEPGTLYLFFHESARVL